MPRALIVGSGPSAAGVALALSGLPDWQVVVLDLGGRLESTHQAVVQRMHEQRVEEWAREDLDVIREQPVAQRKGELPQKRSYGSDFPFRDLGQLTGVAAALGGNKSVISSAYGGFSNVWGAQAMPFSRSTFQRWPIHWQDIEPHYKAVLQEVPLAAERDDFEELFPLLGPAKPLPPADARTRAVLANYQSHRGRLRSQGTIVGKARLALRAPGCVSCGLCMTGCPHELIYSASQTFDWLRAQGRITYHPGVLVERVGQRGEEVFAVVRDLASNSVEEVLGDRLFLGAGGIGTTKLVLASLDAPPAELEMGESIQFVLPFLSRRPLMDPRRPEASTFTLNQFNILLDDGEGYTTSNVHCYPYNPAVYEALPGPLRHRSVQPLTTQLLRRVTAGIGYLPSWESPRVRLRYGRGPGGTAEVDISSTSSGRPKMLREVFSRLLRAAPHLDLWPVVPAATVSGPAKTYHFGGSFAHLPTTRPTGAHGTDRLGRVPAWSRVHLVDGSVLPSVPSTTFTLTVMANAHRIATETVCGGAQ